MKLEEYRCRTCGRVLSVVSGYSDTLWCVCGWSEYQCKCEPLNAIWNRERRTFLGDSVSRGV